MRRYRIILVVLFLPVAAVVVALLGSWGSTYANITFPLASVIQLAFIGALWRASDARLRTLFTAGTIVTILLLSIELSTLRLFHYAVGGLPVTVVLTHAMLLWTCVVLVDLIGTNLRLNRIGQIVGLVTVIGAAFIAVALEDFQQLILFAVFPIAFFAVQRPADRLVLGITFFAGIALELYATTLGAWTWAPGVLQLPRIGSGFANPPYGAGGLYALAQALLILVMRWIEPRASMQLPPAVRRMSVRRNQRIEPPLPPPVIDSA